jgi:hypothetical protein
MFTSSIVRRQFARGQPVHEGDVGERLTKRGNPSSIRHRSRRRGAAACPPAAVARILRRPSARSRCFYTRVADGCAFTSHEDPLGTAGNRWFGRGTRAAGADKLRAPLDGYKTGTFIRAMVSFTGQGITLRCQAAQALSTAGGLPFIGGGGLWRLTRRLASRCGTSTWRRYPGYCR